MAYGFPPALAHRFKGLLPALADAYAEFRRAKLDVRAEDAAHLNVTDAIVYCVGPVHPMLLHQIGFEAQVRGNRGHLARVVRLHASNRHECVAPLREGIGNEVLELADLVATAGQAAVAVLTLGPDLGAT
jgi:hypothetical protein